MSDRKLIPIGADKSAEWVLEETWDDEKREWLENQWCLYLRDYYRRRQARLRVVGHFGMGG